MATIRGGAKICDGCGKDCTHLYGMVMEVRKDMMQNARVKVVYEKIDEIFGQHDFIFCWECTAKAFGAMTLAQKRAEVARAAKGTKNGKEQEGGAQNPLEEKK